MHVCAVLLHLALFCHERERVGQNVKKEGQIVGSCSAVQCAVQCDVTLMIFILSG